MTVFALDSSGKTAEVCVLRGGEVLAERRLDAGLTHSETLLPLVDETFRAAGLAPADVDLYAVTAGPGSFTGLRIGMALVKGLALPGGTPAVGVSTLEAMALGSGLAGLVAPVLNARRGEVYWAAFHCGPAGCRRLAEDAAGPAEEVAKAPALAGQPIIFIGDGAELCYNTYDYSPVAAAPPPRIAYGAALAAVRLHGPGRAEAAADMRPRYLRLSQAERERAARLQAQQNEF